MLHLPARPLLPQAGDVYAQVAPGLTGHAMQAIVTNLDDARLQVDDAIATALLHRQPCHIQIACNLANIPHPTFEVSPDLHSSPSTWELASMHAALWGQGQSPDYV